MLKSTSHRLRRLSPRPHTALFGLLALLAFGCSKSEIHLQTLATNPPDERTRPSPELAGPPTVSPTEPGAAPAVAEIDPAGMSVAVTEDGPAEIRTWRTNDGASFEAKLVWVSRTGSALRFEKADGESLLYATDHLAEEERALIHNQVVIK